MLEFLVSAFLRSVKGTMMSWTEEKDILFCPCSIFDNSFVHAQNGCIKSRGHAISREHDLDNCKPYQNILLAAVARENKKYITSVGNCTRQLHA